MILLFFPSVKPEKFNFTVEAVKNGSLCKSDTVNITCSAVGKPSVHTYQVFEDGNLVHTSNTGELFLSHATATGGDVHYTCVANNTVAIANTTKNITVNGNDYCCITLALCKECLEYKYNKMGKHFKNINVVVHIENL